MEQPGTRLGGTKLGERIVRKIREGQCTPFLGAGMAADVLPLASQLAEEWAKEHGYPLRDSRDLGQVAQFLAIKEYSLYPKEQIKLRFKQAGAPDFDDPHEPHRALAELPFPLYITTNYDDFMIQALAKQGKKPRRGLCPWWTDELEDRTEALEHIKDPSDESPIVYHLHGHCGEEASLVVTQQDYVNFLTQLSDTRQSSREMLIAGPIQRALSKSLILFIGYSLTDWTFQVIFHSLTQNIVASSQQSHLAVQLPPDSLSEEGRTQAQKYLSDYYKQGLKVEVFWGTARDFVAQLHELWNQTQP
jgi:hypothetical protein